MGQWTDENPSAGDREAIADWASSLRSDGRAMDGVVLGLDRPIAEVPGFWQGGGVDAWTGLLAADKEQGGEISAGVVAGAAAADTYADTLADLAAREATVHADIADALQRKNAHYMYDSSSSPDDQTFRRWEREHSQAQLDLAAGSSALAALADERRTADTAFASAVRHAIPGSWPARRAALITLGITDPADATQAEIIAAGIDAAGRLVDRNGVPPDADEVAALQLVFDLYGADETVMSQFYASLGGERTARLVNTVGLGLSAQNRDPAIRDEVLRLAESMRAGLATGSAFWPTPLADDFAHSMFEYVGDGTGVTNSVAFLFDGPPYLGGTLASAAMLEAEQWERTTGRPLISDSALHTDGGGWALLSASHPGDADAVRAGLDLSGRVLETLGQHPERAMDYLYPNGDDPENGKGSSRIDFWYRDRDWSRYDGFEGVSALWAGAQSAPGGLTTGTYDPDVAERQARLASQVMNALAGMDGAPGNAAFIGENVSGPAAVSLVTAVAPYLPYLTNSTLFGGRIKGDELPNPAAEEVPAVPGTGGERWAPTVGANTLAGILGVAGANSGGRRVLARFSDGYLAVLKAGVLEAESPAVAGLYLERIAAIDGFMHGALGGAQVENARAADGRTQAAVDAGLSVITSIPIPVLGGLKGPIGALVGTGQTMTIVGAETTAAQSLVGLWLKTPGTLEQVEADHRKAANENKTQMLTLLMTYLGQDVSELGKVDWTSSYSNWQRRWDQLSSELTQSPGSPGYVDLNAIGSEWDKSYDYGS